MSKKIILGGGIAGLIKAYYNPDAIIVSKQIGGQFKSDFQLGPRFFHVDENSKKFFKDLGLNPEIKKIKIGFYYDNELHSENNEENRKKYFEKTRGESSEPYKSVMSGNITEFDSFDIDINVLMDTLLSKINNQIIEENAIKIDVDENEIVTENNVLEYDELISTIPLNIFLFLTGNIELAKKYISYPTTFVLSDMNDCPFDDFKDFDYVYVSSKEYKYHRITNTPDGPVFEYKGDEVYETENEINRFTLKVGQLVHNENTINIKNVEFFGRYATWKHGIKTNELLKSVYDKMGDLFN